jgi:hypothetical protein
MSEEDNAILDDFANMGILVGSVHCVAIIDHQAHVSSPFYQPSLPYIVFSSANVYQPKLFVQLNWKVIEEGRATSRGLIHS